MKKKMKRKEKKRRAVLNTLIDFFEKWPRSAKMASDPAKVGHLVKQPKKLLIKK